MDEEILTLIKLAQDGDKDAAQIIIERNTGLIWSVVKKFTNRGYDSDDLFQLGSIGLLKCIQKFDTKFGVKFSTYAVPMIMGEIKRFIRDDGMIKVSRNLKEISTKAKYMKDLLTKQNNDEPTISELAIALNISPEELVMALDADKEIESIYSTVYQSDGKNVYLIDKIADKTDNDMFIDNIVIQQIIEDLDPREQQIIKIRYFEDKTQSDAAKEIGVSQVQISRIEKRIIAKIREKFF